MSVVATPVPWLARAAALHPERAAVELAGGAMTYVALHAEARVVAGRLARDGVRAGELVGLALPAGADFAVALHACLLLGAVAVPLDPRLAADERAAQAAGCAVVLDALPAGRAGALPGFAGVGDAPLMVVHTSGTTGAPVPVLLTYGNVLANALGSAVALGLDPAERWLCPLPLSHVGGLMVMLRSAIYATTAVLQPAPFDAEATAAALGRVTLASLVPTMLARVLDAGPPAAPGLRAILLGGAGAPRAVLARARSAELPVRATYGLTQACSQVTVAAAGDLETAGHPLPGIGVAIAADGEILVSGPTVAGGGTLATGDLGRLDASGRLIVVGRKADTIVTGGENVAPAEVEAVLVTHPAVADVAVVGRPDAEWGEAVTALVVPRDGAAVDAGALRAFCAERLAGYKVPKAVEPVGELPRTASGKLLRRVLPR